MSLVFKLKNVVKHYNWGDAEHIPKLLGENNARKESWAELWMGVHPEGLSELENNGVIMSLADFIEKNPHELLGTDKFENIPFLFKLLAAGKPLSIQVHPSLEQAKEGFERENLAGIPLKAPHRNYKDANHKLEILCAIENFRALVGLREPKEIAKRFKAFAECLTIGFLDFLTEGFQETTVVPCAFFKKLLTLSQECKEELTDCVLKKHDVLFKNYPEYAKEWEVLIHCASLYPNDAGILVPLYLNVIDLLPEEAIYIPEGIPHTYISGFGVELMSNSDNVLRGGLTSKHIDTEEFLKVLDFKPFYPKILSSHEGVYPSSYKEFTLSLFHHKEEQGSYCPTTGPAIVMITSGSANIGDCVLRQGESAFISACNGKEIGFTGTHTVYIAEIGRE